MYIELRDFGRYEKQPDPVVSESHAGMARDMPDSYLTQDNLMAAEFIIAAGVIATLGVGGRWTWLYWQERKAASIQDTPEINMH